MSSTSRNAKMNGSSGSKGSSALKRRGGEGSMGSADVGFVEEKPKRKVKAVRYGLLSYEELPEYMKENEFILRFYRSEWPFKNAFFSLFSWHNETINVWTHLIGFLLFLGLTAVHLRGVPAVADLLSHFSWTISGNAMENASYNLGNFYRGVVSNSKANFENTLLSEISMPAPRWPFFTFLAGSMFCLLTSSICHLFSCHSHRVNLFLSRFDYVGIAVMIVTSFFPPIYYIFQCEPHWQFIYLAGITIMGGFTIFTLLAPHLTAGSFRTFRALLFAAMGFSGIIPAIHATIVNWNEPQRPITLAYESAMAVLYVTGTLFYVSRVPERWKPGFFDLTGHSHQIFHVFVIGGALAHYGAALILLEWRDRVGCDKLM